jgi:hypothetical protein
MPIILNDKSITKINDTFPSPGVTIETVKSSGNIDGNTVINQPVVPLPQVVSSPNVSSETIDADYKYMAFTHSGGSEDQTEYSLNFNIETECDILIVGGGGGGGCDRSGGGGSGACIVYPNYTMNGNYKIKVGKGGLEQTNSSLRGNNGYDSEITNLDSSIVHFKAKGGGGGASLFSSTAGDGGSGGGRTSQFTGLGGDTVNTNIVNTTQTGPTITSSYAVYGNIGGRNTASWTGDFNVLDGGGGGGIGEGGSISGSLVPVDSQYTTNYAGKGGDGLYQSTINNITYNFKNHFGAGVLESDGYYYIGGGGGGGDSGTGTTTNNGGKGGGGDGGDGSGGSGINALSHTGSGGGGGSEGNGAGASGGSGIVIIRYKVTDATMVPKTLTYTTPERLYPPTTNLTSVSHIVSGESYGNGVYETSNSTQNTSNDLAYNVFNSINTTGYISESYQYSSGVYDKNNYIVSDYKGDWLKIRLPYAITLKRYGLKQRPESYEVKAPGKYKIYGSNDGTNWDVLVHKTEKITYNLQISETNDYYEERVDINQTYQYFSLVVNELFGSDHNLNFDKWYIYGQEFISEEPDYKILTFEYQGPSYPVIDSDSINLVAWYKFDGDDVADSSGNGYDLESVSLDGTLQTDFTYPSLKIPENNKYLFPLSITQTLMTQNWSISFYVKIDSANSSSTSTMLFGIRTASTEPYDDIYMIAYPGSSGNPKVGYNIWNDRTQGTASQFNYNTQDGSIFLYDTWHYITLTMNKTDTDTTVNIYNNGTLIDSQTKTTNFTLPYLDSTMQMALHDLNRSNTFANNDNKIIYYADFRIYDKALSATEISDLYNQYNQTVYTVNFPAETTCDILIVGGGGGGGRFGGGGGGGGVLFKNNITLNGTYTIKTGKGGTGASDFSSNGSNGYASLIMIDSLEYIAKGGGGGGTRSNNTGNPGRSGNSGGSGGGGSQSDTGQTYGGLSVKNTYTGWESYGNSGGSGKVGGSPWVSGGGGGAGSNGQDWSNTNGGNGGTGKEFISYFGTNFGHNGYFAGGGGGNIYVSIGTQGYGNGGNELYGGGGDGAYDGNPDISAVNGLPNTGGGGGGGKFNGGTIEDLNGGHGGSGIVIIRYKAQYNQVPYNAQWTYSATDASVHHYGNVGIGTLADSTKSLTVRGDMNLTGDYYQNNETFGKWLKKNNNIYREGGKVGVGIPNPVYNLHVMGEVFASEGGISGNGSTSWTTTSDSRIKENIMQASYKECYEIFKKINLYKYNYDSNFVETKDKNQLGFIAQEVQTQLPESVKTRKMKFKNGIYIDDTLTLNVSQINYVLFGAFKYLMGELEIIKKHLPEPIVEDTTLETNTGTNVDTNTGTIEDTNTGTNVDTNTGTNVETNTGTNVDTTLETNTGTIEDTTLETNTGTNVDTTLETNTSTNVDTTLETNTGTNVDTTLDTNTGTIEDTTLETSMEPIQVNQEIL